MPASREDVLAALQRVNDPELHRDLISLNRLSHLDIGEDGRVQIGIRLDALNSPIKRRLREDIEQAVGGIPGVSGIEVEFSSGLTTNQPEAKKPAGGPAPEQQNPQDQARAGNPLPDVKHIIAVGAGKGGVGKSTVAVNLAIALSRAGQKVGILDGDIYGPSLPTMLGTENIPPKAVGQTIIPYNVHGLKAMSVGSLVEEDQALIWRGPMAHGAFRQLATQTSWGELDTLVIDMPPGTGDVPLTLAQLLPLTGAVIVCTPQKVAQDDARRAITMFRQLGIDVLGLVENMSYFIGDDGKEYDIFGRGGAEMLAQQQGVAFLGTVPINTALRRNADAGDPTANFTSDDQLSAELTAVAQQLMQQVRAHELDEQFNAPTITVRG
ncbi:MAG: Mrp/NBP35 family ATP-binding protein [Phycisphaerales bacterium JB063]